jgi:hypothetical protein
MKKGWRHSGPKSLRVPHPNASVTLTSHGQPSEGGIRVRLADNRASSSTRPSRPGSARLADELARVAMERLFASAPDLGTLVHG